MDDIHPIVPAQILSALTTKWAGRELVVMGRCGSTNDEAQNLAKQQAPAGTCVLADTQDAGRGRRARTWHSPPGKNIYMSMVLKPHIPPDDAGALTLAAAVAVSDGIESVTGLHPHLKWPNDILIAGRKVCGILTEMVADQHSIQWVILGIGCNVNQVEFPDDIRGIATSLSIASGTPVDRAALVASIIGQIEQWHDRYVAEGKGVILEAWKRHPNVLGHRVTVHPPQPAPDIVGTALDLDSDGALLVTTDSGVERVLAGDLVEEFSLPTGSP
ncbi:MAG: biotin--[acetyl-CoA-carboxylase] ligase [Deltaproteobacteria bacterium]|nr:biotin--[acetyl-CoA-carboxylase] ligase [Deltaproteobacteria bacterium]